MFDVIITTKKGFIIRMLLSEYSKLAKVPVSSPDYVVSIIVVPAEIQKQYKTEEELEAEYTRKRKNLNPNTPTGPTSFSDNIPPDPPGPHGAGQPPEGLPPMVAM